MATPIGNVGDLSPRAREVLSAADVILCEDTRHSGRLFERAGVSPRRLLSLHEHNEAARSGEVIALLREGRHVALVSDAGTPAISDPGRRVVAAAHEEGAKVTVVPGPSAVTAAVAVSGLTEGPFVFLGFLDRKGRGRREALRAIAGAAAPSVLYEAPRRVEGLLSELAVACDDTRLVVVCRELTKLHEEVWRGELSEAAGRWPPASARGEFVIVVGAAPRARAGAPAAEIRRSAEAFLSAGQSRRDAVRETADRLGVSTREVYDALRVLPGSGEGGDL